MTELLYTDYDIVRRQLPSQYHLQVQHRQRQPLLRPSQLPVPINDLHHNMGLSEFGLTAAYSRPQARLGI